MESREFSHIIIAIIILTLIGGVPLALANGIQGFAPALFFAVLIIFVAVFSKKVMASLLDADVEHETWKISRYGFKAGWRLEKEIPGGVLLPLFVLIFSLGKLKIPTLLTYETHAKKIRAAKRFGFYSYTEITDWHNSIIGAASVIALIILATLAYFLAGTSAFLPQNLEYLAQLTTFYVFWNLIPYSKLDGMQILMGSRVLYAILATIAVIFMAYALTLLITL